MDETFTEWAIQYEDGQVSMQGEKTITMIVGSRESAEKALGFDFGSWPQKKNRRVVTREVTAWRKPNG